MIDSEILHCDDRRGKKISASVFASAQHSLAEMIDFKILGCNATEFIMHKKSSRNETISSDTDRLKICATRQGCVSSSGHGFGAGGRFERYGRKEGRAEEAHLGEAKAQTGVEAAETVFDAAS